jgi:hypothetical protein
METISFKKIYDFIKKELQKNSIDAIYINKHKYFENNVFLYYKMIESVYATFKLGFYSELFGGKYFNNYLFESEYDYSKAKSPYTPNKEVVEIHEKRVAKWESLSNNYYETY